MKKSFGQHYLTDNYFLEKIVSKINLQGHETVLEIGAGSGILTFLLAKKSNRVFAVEVEHDAIRALEKRIQSQKLNNIFIIKESILKLDIKKISKQPLIIVGNIPYNLTSKILFKLFGEIDEPAEHLSLLKTVYLMVQKEVAERLVALPGNKSYSPLSLSVQYFTQPSILFYVSKEAFTPPPKVESAFVKFEINNKFPEIQDKVFFKKIVRISFQQKRKKIINALNKLISDKKLLEKTFHALGVNPGIRPECLSFDEYIKLSDHLKISYKP